MSKQQVLLMTTSRDRLRSAAEGWSAEDADLVRPGHIGNTPGFPGPYSYETPLHALGDGWHLLAPPQSFRTTINDGETTVERWGWWFVRESAALAMTIDEAAWMIDWIEYRGEEHAPAALVSRMRDFLRRSP